MLWPPFSFPQVLNELLVLGIDFLGDNGPALTEACPAFFFNSHCYPLAELFPAVA
jgi:hypothetical protein